MATLTTQQERVRDLHRSGVTKRQIALALGISTQRVYQILERLRELGELVEEAS